MKMNEIWKAKPKVISYGDSYVPILGISAHSRGRKALKAFVIILSVMAILTYLKLNLFRNAITENNSSTEDTLRHSNPCRHVVPEPEIVLQEKFDSNDYFFPNSYKERICDAPNRTRNQDKENLQTCFEDEYHCVTRYKRFEVVRIPYPGNLTSKHWKVEAVHIAVACECSQTIIVKAYGT